MQIMEMEVYLEAFIGCTPLHNPGRVTTGPDELSLEETVIWRLDL